MKLSTALLKALADLTPPAIIAISGYGGAGKSTVAAQLGDHLRCPIIGVDAFFKDRDRFEGDGWECIDFARLAREVFQPFVSGARSIPYGHFDWGRNAIVPRTLTADDILIVEGVGLFRPALKPSFALTIWVDCEIDEATRRGIIRDRDVYHNPQDEKWRGVWRHHDVTYAARYRPREAADFVVDNNAINPKSQLFR
jgi:uridine kinase